MRDYCTFTASWLFNKDTDLVEALKADTESNDFLMPRQNLRYLWTWKPIIPLSKSLTSQLSPTCHTNCSSRHSARCSVCRSRSCVKTRFKNRGGGKKTSISVWLGEAKWGRKKKKWVNVNPTDCFHLHPTAFIHFKERLVDFWCASQSNGKLQTLLDLVLLLDADHYPTGWESMTTAGEPPTPNNSWKAMQLSIYAILLIIWKDADGGARFSQLVWREQTTNEYILWNRDNTLLVDKTSIFDGKVLIN